MDQPLKLSIGHMAAHFRPVARHPHRISFRVRLGPSLANVCVTTAPGSGGDQAGRCGGVASRCPASRRSDPSVLAALPQAAAAR